MYQYPGNKYTDILLSPEPTSQQYPSWERANIAYQICFGIDKCPHDPSEEPSSCEEDVAMWLRRISTMSHHHPVRQRFDRRRIEDLPNLFNQRFPIAS